MPGHRLGPLLIEPGSVSIRPTYRHSRYYHKVPGVALWERPPIQIVICPQDHFWARINSNYVRNTHGTPAAEVWCSEHQVEREAQRRQRLSAARIEAWKRYNDQPLPPSRRCTNPDPKSHPPGAVLPIDQFYFRTGEPRKDGGRSIHVIARCKRCEIEAANERQALMSRVTRNRYQRNYRRNKKRRAETTSRSRKVDATLFLEWAHFVRPEFTETEERWLSHARENGNVLPYHIIDGVMTRCGATDQLAIFYP